MTTVGDLLFDREFRQLEQQIAALEDRLRGATGWREQRRVRRQVKLLRARLAERSVRPLPPPWIVH